MKRYCIGLIIGLALIAGTAFPFFQKVSSNSVLFNSSGKNLFESIVRVIERLDNSKCFRQLQVAIDELLAECLYTEEDRETKELDRKPKHHCRPKSTDIG